ncbi:MAG TPA: PrsW family glutamic-type intramembrane protease, partial [Aggregatilineales bacterium]|nr:PrsW family glutamic-type intramembrane protease [Aggregatilineales bacterium]
MSVGISSVIAYIIAIAVPLFAIYMIFALDLFGTGKGSTVLIAFAWGALGAFTLALIINNWTNDWLTATIGPDAAYTTVVTRSAPIVEEILKSLVLIYLVFQPRFRYIVDGAVYGFATGIGFSVTENLFYLTTDPALMAT